MDELRQVEEFMETCSTEELAEVVDGMLETAFDTIDATFNTFYEKELMRLKELDALREHIKCLRKYKNKLNKYKEKQLRYDNLKEHSATLLHMYEEWKDEKEKIYISVTDEEFRRENYDEIKSITGDDLNLSLLRKVFRYARNSTSKNGLELKEPEFKDPELKYPEDFKRNSINIKKSKKSSVALLSELRKPILIHIACCIIDALNTQNTELLRINILFLFAHRCTATTKGKEYSRTDKQEIKDVGKTSGASYHKLYAEYISLLDELNLDK